MIGALLRSPGSEQNVSNVRGRLRAPWDSAFSFVTSARGYWSVLACYVVLHATLRLWASPNIGTDEVDQALAAQAWAWGFGPRNPPLHAWMLMGSYSVFGVSLLAHVVLKYTLIFALHGFFYLCARHLLKTPGLAEVCAFSLLLMGPIGWTAHTGYTHTLALGAAMFATLWAFLRVYEKPSLARYLIMGLCLGLGCLAKYNFILFAGAIFAAMLWFRSLRTLVLNWRFMGSIATALIVIGPHAYWMLTQSFDYAQQLQTVTGMDEADGYFANVGRGLGSLLETTLLYLAPLWIVFAAVFAPVLRRPSQGASPPQQMLGLALGLVFVALLAGVFFAQVTEFKPRYMAAALLTAPLVGFALLDNRGVERARLAAMVGASAVGAAIVFGGLIGQAAAYHYTCTRCWHEMPIDDFAQRIRTDGIEPSTIIAGEIHVAGTLRLAFPDAAIIDARDAPWAPERNASGDCLLVWNVRMMGEAPPEHLVAFVTQRIGAAPAGVPIYVDLPLRRSVTRVDRFAYWPVTNADAKCRSALQAGA